MIAQVPGGNNMQAAGDGAAEQHHADQGADGLAPANPHEAANHRDEAELDDDEDDEEGDDDDEEEEDDEEGREEDAADANNGGQGQYDQEKKVRCSTVFTD